MSTRGVGTVFCSELLRASLLCLTLITPSVAGAQRWFQPPGLHPGTSIPYAPQFIPSAAPSQPILTQAQPMQVVPDPLMPASFVSAVSYDQLSPAYKVYALEYIAVDELRVLGPWNGEVLRSSIMPRQGILLKPLPLAEFYDRVGGELLRREYVSRSRQKTGLIAGGATAIGVGMVMATVGGVFLPMAISDTNTARRDGKCPTYAPGGCGSAAIDANATVLGIGSALVIAGIALFSVGLAKTTAPIEAPEARLLTMAFNQALRQRLGITSPAQLTVPAPLAEKPATETSTSQPAQPDQAASNK